MTAAKSLRYVLPVPIGFTLAVVGMILVSTLALDTAAIVPPGMPSWFLGSTRVYVGALSRTLFGSRWQGITQFIAVSAWIAHAAETVYMHLQLSRAVRDGVTISLWAWCLYILGTFLGGFTQILSFNRERRRLRGEKGRHAS